MSADSFRNKVFSLLHSLAKETPAFEDVRMLVGSADTTATLMKQDVTKSIDTDWIAAIENALPALDAIVRNPAVAIEDVDEILPVELSRHITDKSIKHLAQHTNLILDVKGDEVIPQKILNVYHDETYLTYENKFINTLLQRLYAFVDTRYRALLGGSGRESRYVFDYTTSFDHHDDEDGGRNQATVRLNIELVSPMGTEEAPADEELDARYAVALERLSRINAALISYRSSDFAQKMGKNYIRPPVIRTNAILKNKNMKECLTLWEFIDTFDKVGYVMNTEDALEMPTAEYVRDLYSTVALQYLHFYQGVVQSEDTRLLAQKDRPEMEPEFESNIRSVEDDEYRVYDTEYKKMVPVSRLASNRKKLSEDERRISDAIDVALRADELMRQAAERAQQERLARAEAARIARERAMAREAVIRERIRPTVIAYADEPHDGADLVIPMTRKAYLALPRKKKKRVLANARKLAEQRKAGAS